MIKVYLAAAFGRQAEMRRIRDEIETFSEGNEKVISSWIDVEVDDATPDTVGNADEWQHHAIKDLAEVRDADIMVSFTDGTWARGGRHVEFGYAYANDLALIVIGPKEHIFHSLPGVIHFETWERFKEFSDEIRERDARQDQ